MTLYLAGGAKSGSSALSTALSAFSPCNEGKPWWEKRGLVTDLCYWVFAPLFTRYLRIWATVFALPKMFGLKSR